MANKKISSLDPLGGTPADTDIIPITDVSDTTGSAQGTTKKVTVANLMSAGLFSDIVSETTTARTLSDSDCGKVIDCSNGSAVTITIPSTVSAGFNCTVVQSGAGQVTIAAGASVNLYCYSSTKATAGQYAAINIIPYATNSYVLEGDLASSGGGGGASFSNGYALEFDGTDDYVEVTGLGLSGATSFSMWFNPQASATYYPILHKDNPTGIYILFNGPTLYVYLYDTTNGGYLSKNYTLNQSIGDWHHIMVTVDATSNLSALKLYIDGSEVSAGNALKSGTYTSFNVPSSTPLDIGARTSGSVFANQLIDEVAIFGSELSASQITNIYRGEDNGGSGGTNGVPGDLSTFNPVGWWRMGDTGSDYGTTTITNAANAGTYDATIANATSGTNTSGAAFHDLSTAPDSIYVA